MSWDAIEAIFFGVVFFAFVIMAIRKEKRKREKPKFEPLPDSSRIPEKNGPYRYNVAPITFDQSGATVKAVFIDDQALTGFIVKKSDVSDCFGLAYIAQAAVRKEDIPVQLDGMIRKPDFLAKDNDTDKVIGEITEKMNDSQKIFFMEHGHIVEISVPHYKTRNIVLGYYVYAILAEWGMKPSVKGSTLCDTHLEEMKQYKFFDT